MNYRAKHIGLLLSDSAKTDIFMPGGSYPVPSPAYVTDYPIKPEISDEMPQTKQDLAYQTMSALRASQFSGTVIDSQSGAPLPGATVSFYNGPILITRQIADSNGNFSTSADGATIITVSSASYQSNSFPASEYQHTFELERNNETLPGVTVQAVKSNSAWMLLLLLPLLAKKKSVSGAALGKIDTGTVVTIAVAGVALIGFDVVKKLLEGIGVWDDKHTKDLDTAATNPGSPWNPDFWKSGPMDTWLLQNQEMVDMLSKLDSSFGAFGDDESAAISVFTSLQTQSQLSYFADFFARVNLPGIGGNLLTWLRGGMWPNDRLSDKEVDQINDYISKLPKYRP